MAVKTILNVDLKMAKADDLLMVNQAGRGVMRMNDLRALVTPGSVQGEECVVIELLIDSRPTIFLSIADLRNLLQSLGYRTLIEHE